MTTTGPTGAGVLCYGAGFALEFQLVNTGRDSLLLCFYCFVLSGSVLFRSKAFIFP